MNLLKYEDKSNLELNKLVAERRGLLIADEDSGCYNYDYREKYPSTIWVAKQENGNQIEPWEQVNYVLSPVDCDPLIEEQSISLTKCVSSGNDTWFAYIIESMFADIIEGIEEINDCDIFSIESVIKSQDKKRLRAAVVCFLLATDEDQQ
ncbi:hypothetical protein G5Y03_001151 [Vibrio parahaemolyticus]|nr:hypothetical protein [Vibrio parahaemolyticus]